MKKNNQPFFSIITCTYNIGSHLQKNIESLQSQTFRSFEHIFIDGYSTDKTVKIIQGYQKKQPKVVTLHQAKPKGIWNAINQGNQRARGTYVLHLEGDNWLHDANVLADAHAFLTEHPDLDWMYGQIDTITSQGRSIGTFPNRWLLQQGLGYLLKFFNFIPQEAMFVKRQVFKKFGTFDESLKTCSDYDYWLKMAPQTNWQFFNRVITDYQIRSDAISSNPQMQVENLRNMLLVQRRHLNGLEFQFVKFFNQVVERRNAIYKNAS